MKTGSIILSSPLLFAVVVAAAGSVGSGAVAEAFEKNRYMGFNATTNEEDIAICGKGLFGCVGVPSTGRRCDRTKVIFGSFDDIGTGYQTWRYEEGLLMSNSPDLLLLEEEDHVIINEDDEWCLSVAMPTRSAWSIAAASTEWEADRTYTVELQTCDPSNLQQRWLLNTNDGRIHNMDNTQFCLTIQSQTYAALQAQGSPMVLQHCKNQMVIADKDDAQQELLPKGFGLSSFLYADQSEYGVEDVIRLAFSTLTTGVDGNNNIDDGVKKTAEIRIYEADPSMAMDMEESSSEEDESAAAAASDSTVVEFYYLAEQQPLDAASLVSSKVTCMHSDVWKVDAAELVASTTSSSSSSSTIYFVAQLGDDASTRVTFAIQPSQDHGLLTSSDAAAAAAAAAAGVLLPLEA